MELLKTQVRIRRKELGQKIPIAFTAKRKQRSITVISKELCEFVDEKSHFFSREDQAQILRGDRWLNLVLWHCHRLFRTRKDTPSQIWRRLRTLSVRSNNWPNSWRSDPFITVIKFFLRKFVSQSHIHQCLRLVTHYYYYTHMPESHTCSKEIEVKIGYHGNLLTLSMLIHHYGIATY